jgi:poly(3-hydroxybutyrate) depolymerase
MSSRSLLVRCLGLAGIALGCAGCPQYRDPTVPNPIYSRQEPDSEAKYLLYQPSKYDPSAGHPLVVVCHGTPPFDTPLRQIRDWVRLAEEKGFIVVAPFLKGTRAAGLFDSAAKQIERQYEDERRILAVIRQVRGSHNISDDRVFLAGWSAGSYAVLHTGLRHPEIFRALAVLQGNFNAAYFADVADSIDPNQPVYVLYSSSDILTGRDGRRCVEWLQSHGANVTEEITGGSHMGHPKKACEFFEHVVRTVPWLHIRAFQVGDDPHEVHFKIRASFEPKAYAWSFGDGETSPIAAPRHSYAQDGTYRVELDATTPDGQSVSRMVEVKVGGR